MNKPIMLRAALSLMLSLFASLVWGQLHLVAPLGVTTSAKPMVLLVAGKDHKLFYEAYNDASDVNGDGILDVRFNPSITYYGLFDSGLCYTYSSYLFSPASTTTTGKCSGQWSGNWLNYVTTSRIDALRKVLYGGMREVDSTNQTILRRAYIPQDAHSWAKEYTSEAVDGYKISDYTPLAQPASDRRHFFGNLTSNASTNCATLSNCSNLYPLLSVVTNSTKRVWEWASKERPVLDGTHGGNRTDYAVRVEVCTATYHNGCKKYGSIYKPIGLLHDYGENEAMLFGLLTGSYNKNMSGGVLRKVVASFKDEVDPNTGQFTANNTIVKNFDNLRIRDFNNGWTNQAYRGGWVVSRPMVEGEFVDWGNPIAEMMYEGLRYFAGKNSPTADYDTSGSHDGHVGLTRATWDNPYNTTSSAAKAPWCAKANMLVMSDVNPSFDSDQIPGTSFGGFSGDIAGLNVSTLANTITSKESGIAGLRFIGQSGSVSDGAPTAKNVTSLANIRGLAPEEPTKQGSYYSASIAYYGKTNDLNPVQGDQTVDSFFVALSSPLPRIEFPVSGGRTITVVPFAKSVGGFGISAAPNQFQPTNQIVDFYVDRIVNLPGTPINTSINSGRPSARFRINYEDVEQGADHDMDAIAEYTIELNAHGQVVVSVDSTYASGGIIQHMGYVISGTTSDGVYLVVRDKDTAAQSDVDYYLDTPNTQGVALPLTSIRTFTPGGTAATLLKDPLWYAAKWGGFVDRNANKEPDLNYEWDANGDGTPDTYFLVQNPLKLKDQLRRALDNIIERHASASNITANSTSITTDTRVFQAIFNSGSWYGDLLAYPVSAGGVGATPIWSAADNLPLPGSRKIFTHSGGAAKEFLWSQLSQADQTALGSSDVLDYLRGVRTKELQNAGSYRNRSKVLGDIIHSSPYYVKDTDTVYIGSNDGMLHAFNAKTGVELFAYIPSAAIPRLKNLSSPGYSHEYFVDGDIAVSSILQTPGNYLVATLGQGGKGLFGLDVSNPAGFGTSHVKWECFPSGGTVSACNGDGDLGYMLGRPVIAKMNNGVWAVIVGNGYESTSGKAVLFVFNLQTGALIKKIDTLVGSSNGLSAPGVVDEDGDGDVDYIYAGDLKGNVWKFDVSTSSPASWGVKFSGAPLFVAKDGSSNLQPITAQITSVKNEIAGTDNYGKRFVFFGTGSYFRTSDPSDTSLQTWYGLIDDDVKINSRSELKARGIEGTGTVSGYDVRVFQAATSGDMVGKKGWYLDFSTPAGSGERIVTASHYYRFAEPVLIASSIIPKVDPCIPGGDGYVNAINPFTGGRLTSGFFDLNRDKNFGNDLLGGKPVGSFKPKVGMPGEAVIVGDKLIVGGSGGGKPEDTGINLGSSRKGRIAWREIIRQ
jgi:type IV pilus assembly protein PilY1